MKVQIRYGVKGKTPMWAWSLPMTPEDATRIHGWWMHPRPDGGRLRWFKTRECK